MDKHGKDVLISSGHVLLFTKVETLFLIIGLALRQSLMVISTTGILLYTKVYISPF